MVATMRIDSVYHGNDRIEKNTSEPYSRPERCVHENLNIAVNNKYADKSTKLLEVMGEISNWRTYWNYLDHISLGRRDVTEEFIVNLNIVSFINLQ